MYNLKQSVQQELTAAIFLVVGFGALNLVYDIHITKSHLFAFLIPAFLIMAILLLLKIALVFTKRARAFYFVRCFVSTSIFTPWIAGVVITVFRWDLVQFYFFISIVVITILFGVVILKRKLYRVSSTESENLRYGVFNPKDRTWDPSKRLISVSLEADKKKLQWEESVKWPMIAGGVVIGEIISNTLGRINTYFIYLLVLLLPLAISDRFAQAIAEFIFVDRLERKYNARFILGNKG